MKPTSNYLRFTKQGVIFCSAGSLAFVEIMAEKQSPRAGALLPTFPIVRFKPKSVLHGGKIFNLRNVFRNLFLCSPIFVTEAVFAHISLL